MWKISLMVFPPFILVCFWITSEFLSPRKIHLKSNCHNGFLTLVPRTPSQRVIRVILSKRFMLGCSNRPALKESNKQAQLNKKQLWSNRKIVCSSWYILGTMINIMWFQLQLLTNHSDKGWHVKVCLEDTWIQIYLEVLSIFLY